MAPAAGPRAERRRALLRAAFGALALAGVACGEAVDGDLAVRVAVRSVSPREVRTVGGDVVTLDGVNLCPALEVRVGGEAAGRVTVVSPERATVVMPARARGEATLEVSCGRDRARVAQRVRYVASTVELATVDPPPGYGAYADVDGDGWLDGVLETTAKDLELHRGLPGGHGFDPASLAAAAGFRLASSVPQLAVTDLDGDGDADVLLFDDWTVPRVLRCRRLVAGAAGLVDAGEDRIELAGQFELLRVADLDGDGWQDLVLAEESEGAVTVSVRHGEAGGSFGARQPLGVASGAVWVSELVELFDQTRMNGGNGGLARIDLDGDGISDLVWVEGGARWVVVLGRRDRAYAARQVILPSPSGASGLFSFDADRHLDAYAVQCAAPGLRVRVWRGTGVGTFESAAIDLPLASAEWSLHCAELSAGGAALRAALLPRRFDLDGDGRGEFLLESPGPLSWVELSAGSTSDVVAVGTGGHIRQRFASGDALLPGPAGSLRLVDENGSRYLVPDAAARSVVSSRLPPLSTLTGDRSCLGDFDGDGIADLALVADGVANLLHGTGTGRFDGPALVFPVQGATACAAAHLTSAAAADLVTNRAVYRNQGDGTFVEWLPPSGTTSAADVDGDGRDEVLVLTADELTRRGDFQVLAADGPSGFRALAAAEGISLSSGTTPVIADLNGDGHLDEVHCDGSRIVLQYGDAQQAGGSWGDGAAWDLPGQRCDWVRLMRGPSGRFLLSGSGAVLVESEQRVSQRGTGSDGQPTTRQVFTYTLTGVLPFTGVAPGQVALCDLRGRGRTDLVYTPDDYTDAADSLWIADETLGAPATFRARTEWTLEEPNLVGCADVDGDGLEDLVVTRDGRPYLVRNESY